MSKTACTLAALTAAFTLSANGPQPVGHKDIVETAIAAGQFKTLVAAVQAAGLVDTLKGKAKLTVFAPTDRAFSKLPRNTVRTLLKPENRARLQAILTYHVVAGRNLAARVVKTSSLATVNGQRVAVEVGDKVTVGGAGLLNTDILCTNGVIHVIDSVLIPADLNIAEVAAKAGSFKTLLAAAKAAGLVDALVGKGPLTVFAPTDKAFAKIPNVGSLLERKNRGLLTSILKYHVVAGRVYADEAIAASRAKTLQGDAVQIRLSKGKLQINNATVVANDLDASNGVIHVIDTVLMPPKRGRKVVGLTLSKPGAALAAQLGVDRDKTLVVTSVSGNAKAAGLKKYDVLTGIAGVAATSKNLDRAKEERGFGEPIVFRVRRQGRTLKIDVPIGSASH